MKKRKAKRDKKEPKEKTNQQSPNQFATAYNEGRRFETHERICEFLFFAFAVLLSVVNTHKVLIAGCAICAGILAFCFWYDDRELENWGRV